MSTRRIAPSPDQFELFSQLGTDTRVEMPNDVFAEPVPIHVDPMVDQHPGLVTPLTEGWGMLHRVIKGIARERSNRGFVQLPEQSKPVKTFAQRVDMTNPEAIELVDHAAGKKYETAQMRLIHYNQKQQARARDYNSRHQIVDPKVIDDMLPLPVGTVEYRFFYANTPAEAAKKEKMRQVIGAFVRKNT